MTGVFSPGVKVISKSDYDPAWAPVLEYRTVLGDQAHGTCQKITSALNELASDQHYIDSFRVHTSIPNPGKDAFGEMLMDMMVDHMDDDTLLMFEELKKRSLLYVNENKLKDWTYGSVDFMRTCVLTPGGLYRNSLMNTSMTRLLMKTISLVINSEYKNSKVCNIL